MIGPWTPPEQIRQWKNRPQMQESGRGMWVIALFAALCLLVAWSQP